MNAQQQALTAFENAMRGFYPPEWGLTAAQIQRLTDNIGDASACSDNDCSCKRVAALSQLILDGKENYEVIDGK